MATRFKPSNFNILAVLFQNIFKFPTKIFSTIYHKVNRFFSGAHTEKLLSQKKRV